MNLPPLKAATDCNVRPFPLKRASILMLTASALIASGYLLRGLVCLRMREISKMDIDF
jgi:hypothetical protein